MIMRLGLIGIFFVLSGCYIYRPDISEKRIALKLIDEGVLRLRQGDLVQAADTFELAYEVGKLPQALDGLGAVAFLRGDLYRAEHMFRSAYSLAYYPTALGNLALLYEYRGDFERANQLYLQALKEDPTNFRIRGNFSAFLAEYSTRGVQGRTNKNGNRLQRLATKELNKAIIISNDPLLVANRGVMNSKSREN